MNTSVQRTVAEMYGPRAGTCVCGGGCDHDGRGIALGDQVGPATQSMTSEPQFPHRAVSGLRLLAATPFQLRHSVSPQICDLWGEDGLLQWFSKRGPQINISIT